MRVEIITKTICPYCHMAKQHLTDNNIDFSEIVYDDDGERQVMYDTLGLVGFQRTVPQIFAIEGGTRRRIGGYSELLQSDLANNAVNFDEHF